MANGSYLDKYIGTQSLEQYFFRPSTNQFGTNIGLKNLDSTDVHFDRTTVNFNATVISSDTENLMSIVTHTTSSNSAYAFAVGQVMLTRSIIPNLPITLTSSYTALHSIFKNYVPLNDVINDPLLGLGLIGIISIKKKRYGDFIRALTLTATLGNGLVFKDACSASQLHGIMIQDGPNATVMDGSSYWSRVDNSSFNPNGPVITNNSYFDAGTSSNWITLNNPNFIGVGAGVFTWDTNHFYGILSANSTSFSGLGVTGTSTATKFFAHAYYGPISANLQNDVALIVQTPTTSVTAYTTRTGAGVKQIVTNFTSPTSGTVSAYIACRNSASTTFNAVTVREAFDWTIMFWTRQDPTQKSGVVITNKSVNNIVDAGWRINRVNSTGDGQSRLFFDFTDFFATSSMISSLTTYINTGFWTLITLSFSRFSGIKMYVNNVLQTTIDGFDLDNMITNPSNIFVIGADYDGLNNFTGQIGEFLWVNEYAATQQDVSNVYINGISSTGWDNSKVIAFYRWDGNANDLHNFNNLGSNYTQFTIGRYPSYFSALSAGYIFYDLGLITLLGPSTGILYSITTLSSLNFSSSYQITTLAAFCTAQSKEMNYTTNDSAFYNISVTSDPNMQSSTSNYDFITDGFHWGENAATASHSNYYLRDFQNRNPFITTVGLYNDNNELLAVGKCAQPFRKPKNVPITLKFQIDL